MAISLSRFSIRQQILIGNVPVLAVLIFLAFSSFQNFQNFDRSFSALRDITKENIIFLEIERDVVELQRNILVYSYVGYEGVLRKVEFIQQQLEDKFEAVKPVAEQDQEIQDRYVRMLGHYQNYKEGFQEAVREKRFLKGLHKDEVKPLVEKLTNQLSQIQETLVSQDDYKLAYKVSEIEQKMFRANVNIHTFSVSPDSFLIKDTSAIISDIKNKISDLREAPIDDSLNQNIDDFLRDIEYYEAVFKNIVRTNRTYLHLVNVVLAGKAAEIDKLSGELDKMIATRYQFLSKDIQNNVKSSQQQFILLSILAGIIGTVSSVLIALGIASPVRKMAQTLSELSKGKADIEIPGQKRKDEVGQMALAADEFKAMAKNLEYQTKELEEFAYRTSHDLRSPLVSSIALLRLTKEAIDNEKYDKARKSIGLVRESLNKLEALVKDILELTKTKNISEEKTDIDLESFIDNALQKLSHMDNFERLDIQKDLRFLNVFKSQKSRIVLILENLLSNAIKYQDLEKENSYIKVSTYSDLNEVVIEVEDNGLGIPKNHQHELFLMFKRFHPKTSFGSGLGLYMMKKSADVLGGNLEYEDTGSGSRFKLFIPIKHKEVE